jgi:hypothetical protein
MKPHILQRWCIPHKQDAEFVACMEDILELYSLPYDPLFPVICMDEQPVQLLKETRTPIPMRPGRPLRVDYQYERNGTASVFMFVDPHRGWRHASPRQRRTKLDWASEIRELLQVHYPDARKVRLVMDNLNTHKSACLYEAFPPEEARALVRRLEIHLTPKHASWLNMAESELAVFTGQCLCRRIPDFETLQSTAVPWERERNAQHKGIHWSFTLQDARARLVHLYPLLAHSPEGSMPSDQSTPQLTPMAA